MTPSIRWLLEHQVDLTPLWGYRVEIAVAILAIVLISFLIPALKAPSHAASVKHVAPKEVYIGERNEQGQKHGKGLLTYKNGAQYEGQFVDDKPCGKGCATSVSGDVYMGGWLDGKRHGAGEVQYSDGSFFCGTFKSGKKEGRGVLTFKSLDSVEGLWRDGALIEAIIRCKTYIYEGEVANFKPHGRGRMVFLVPMVPAEAAAAAAPTAEEGQPQQQQLLHQQMQHGDTYSGEWCDGLMHGHGVYHFCENNSYYEGAFEGNLLHGHGQLSVVHSAAQTREVLAEQQQYHYNGDSSSDSKDSNSKVSSISCFEGTFEHGIAAGTGIYRSWLGSEYQGELKLLHAEEDGSFSPSKNREAARDSAEKRSRLNSLAESAKKLFMGSHNDEEDDDDDDSEEEELQLVRDSPSINGIRAVSPPRGAATPSPSSREERFQAIVLDAAGAGAGAGADGDGDGSSPSSYSCWDDPLAFMHCHGKGVMLYPNGDRYTGQMRDNCKHGEGKMVFANGSVYEGSFDMDCFHGKGTHTQVVKGQGRNKSYSGDYELGQRSGMGTLIFPSGATYEGQWANDCFWGTGRYRFSNGDVYSGTFVDGKRNGVGRIEYSNGNNFQGEWKDDRRVKGEFKYKLGNSYTGQFDDKVMEGVGRFEWVDGSVYEGGWHDDKAHGIGRFTKPGAGGYVYEGAWVNNKKHCVGEELARVIFANGDVYVGNFQMGKMTGKGKKTFAGARAGEVQMGDFIDGVFQGE